MKNMFAGCKSLVYIDFPNLIFNKDMPVDNEKKKKKFKYIIYSIILSVSKMLQFFARKKCFKNKND